MTALEGAARRSLLPVLAVGDPKKANPPLIDLFTPRFSTDVWARQARELAATRPFSDADVREALLRYSTDPRSLTALNPHSEAVSAVNGQRTPDLQSALLLAPTDATLDSYVERVDALVGPDEWSVAYFGLHAASAALWDVAKSFADQLAHSLGRRPGGRADIDCFVGRYSSTHTGVHVDHAHNFAFTLRDGKTMFAWPGERSDLLGMKSPDYDIHKSVGVALANKTDRVAYFPQEYFHVAESKDAVSVNVNVTFWEAGDDAKAHVDYLREVLRTRPRTRRDVRSSGAAVLGVEDELLLTTLRSLLEDGTLHRRMAVAQLVSDTSARLNVGRPVTDVTEVDDVVRMTPVSTVQWVVLPGMDELLLGANGHVAAFPYSRDLDDFLTRLVAGDKVDIAPWAGDGRTEHEANLLRVVGALARWGAL